MIKSIIAACIAATAIVAGCVLYFNSSFVPAEDTGTEVTHDEETVASETTTEQFTTQTETTLDAITESENVPETIPTDKGGDYIGSVYTRSELSEMDNTSHGYGQGIAAGSDNRPYGAIGCQESYGQYGAVFIAPPSNNIYLTFDEGYENGYTYQILDTLAAKGVKAIFFVTMQYCAANPDLVARMINEGHTLGNHSVSHLSMPTLSLDEMYNEIMALHQYIYENYGYSMHLFRPPMGEYSIRSLCLAQSLGYSTMLWSFSYLDYNTAAQPEAYAAFTRITDAAHGGAVYLLHAVSKTNTDILASVIDDFRQKGYTVAEYGR